MKAINKKLLRDLGRMKGQLITIALVVAVGVACFVALKGTYDSLQLARSTYYERSRFADVFAHLERAPEALVADLEAIDGVSRVESRVVESAMVPLKTMAVPARALLVSLPDHGTPMLNDLHLRKGRSIEPGRADEVVLLDSFAEAHEMQPGAVLPAVINGRLRELRVVGIAMSPEHVMTMAAGDLAPDPKRIAVIWMARNALSAAFQMEGAFNDVTLGLQPGADVRAVVARVDERLAAFGGIGAVGRDKQPSNFMLDSELVQLESMSTSLPVMFLAVAALLLNLVLSRLVHLQRSEIAALKALGYRDLDVGLHFLKLVLLISGLGAAMGLPLGGWLGVLMVDLYREYFKFPDLHFNLDLRAAAIAVGVTFAAASTGAFSAVRSVVKLTPAEAMSPAMPPKYRRSLVDRLGLGRFVGPSLNMIVRELQRQPVRTLMSSLAIACSVGLMVIGSWYANALDDMIETQFERVMQEDTAVTFARPLPERALRDLAHLPGVLHAEGMRSVPVRFGSGHRHRDGVINGYFDDGQLRTLRNRYGEVVGLPPGGVVLTDLLAARLDVRVGDSVEVTVHEGRRGTHPLVVTGLVDEAFGLQGHMRIDALHDWLGEGAVVSVGLLRVDPLQGDAVNARLKEMPQVLGVIQRRDLLARFYAQSGSMIMIMAVIIMLSAATITVGVVYNNARVALSLRGRDLASMRVLGFHRGEISAILLGEQAIQVLIGLPFGLYLGKLMVIGLASMVDPETYRLPVILTAKSYALATVVALAASALSALLVRRRLDRLDLIEVLKTRA